MLIINGSVRKDIFGRYKNLLIIGGGILQHQTLIECSSLGLGKILVDGNPDCFCAGSPYFNNKFFIPASIKDPKAVLSKVKDFLRKNRKIKIVGVYTQGCDVEYTVAYVAEKLGLPSIGSEVAYRCNNKIAMRLAFEKAGIPQPKFSIDDIGDIGLPCVFKPVDNCASRGVTIIHDKNQINKAIVYARGNSLNGKILVEEFIDGKEYSVDTILQDGKSYPAGISDRIFETKDNYAIQDGSITPSLLPAETQKRMYWAMQDYAEALGVKWGAFKGDLIIKDDKIYALEVTARLSGGFDAQFRKPYSFGINLIKATIDLACGKRLDFSDIIPKWNKVSQTFSVFPKPGIIKEIRDIKETMAIPGVMNVFIVKKVGDRVDYKNCADRVCHIIACRDTYKELQETVQRVKETLQFITE